MSTTGWEKSHFSYNKLPQIRIYTGVSTNNFVLCQTIRRPRTRLIPRLIQGTAACRNGFVGELSQRTLAVDPDLPRLPLISLTIFVGHLPAPWRWKYTQNLERLMKQRT